MEKPDVDEIDGIAPPIAIRQKNTTRNPRSTVATSTELYDFLRLLYARVGRTYCPNCGQMRASATRWTRWRSAYARASPKARAGTCCFPSARAGEIGRTARPPLRSPPARLQPPLPGRPDLRVLHAPNRCSISTSPGRSSFWWTASSWRPDLHQRVVDSVEICYREAGEVVFEQANAEPPRRLGFSEKFACKTCGIEFLTPEPRLFSFNSPFGACPRCQGFGNTIDYDLNLVIPDPGLSLDEGAVEPWTKPQYGRYLEGFRRRARGKVRFDVPYCELTTGRARGRAEGRAGLLGPPGNEEVQAARARVPQPVPGIRGVPRLPRRAAAPGSAERARGRTATSPKSARMNIAEAHSFFDSLQLTPEELRHRRQDPAGDPPAPQVPQRRRPGLPHARPPLGHALRRRGAAHPAGHLPGLAPRGRLLRAR